MGQEVKEVDRDLSVVCPGRQLNLWGARHKNIICVESFPRAAFCEWGFPGRLVRGDLVSPASDSVRYLYPGEDFGVSLSSQRGGSMMRNNDDAVSPVIGTFTDGNDQILADRTF